MNNLRILGVDPGSATGGFALYGMGPDDFQPELQAAFDLPTLKSKGRGTEIDILELRDRLAGLVWDHAYIELVQARPGEGRGSGFKFGVGCGIIQGVVVGRGKPFTRIPPGVWKPKMGLNSDKEFSRTRALQLFPEKSSLFRLKKSHNLAEAALIAYYGWMKLEGRMK